MSRELTAYSDGSMDAILSSMIAMFGVVLVASLLANVVTGVTSSSALGRYVQTQSYVGVSDPRDVDATDVLSFIDLVGGHPYVPWVSTNFVNDGPDSVWIAINYPTALYELKNGESASVYRIGAQERIAVIFFVCSNGEEASVRVIGEY